MRNKLFHIGKSSHALADSKFKMPRHDELQIDRGIYWNRCESGVSYSMYGREIFRVDQFNAQMATLKLHPGISPRMKSLFMKTINSK